MNLKRSIITILLVASAALATAAQVQQRSAPDALMVLPFENASGNSELNWIGESFAESLSDLLGSSPLNAISNEERKIIQQRLRISLSSTPSLAAALKMARDGKATLLATGKYSVVQPQGEAAVAISVTAKIIRVDEGRFLSEEVDGKKITRDIVIKDALNNLQAIQGQVSYMILLQSGKSAGFTPSEFEKRATRVPAVAFEAYVKGLVAGDTDAQSREGYFKNAIRIYAQEKSGAVYEDAVLELGHLYLEQRRFPEALDYFSRIVSESETGADSRKHSKNYVEAAFYSGLINWRQAHFDQALAVLRPLAEDLRLTAVYNTLGAIAVHASRIEKKDKTRSTALLNEGLLYLQKAVQTSPDNADARFNYGLALFTNANYAEAIPQLRANLQMRPRDGDCRFLLAKALESIQDPTAAAVDDEAKPFLTDDNRYAKLQTEWARSKVTDLINLRVLLPPRKDFVGVVMVKSNFATEAAPLSETEVLLAKARELYKANQDDDAVDALRRVLFSDPMSAEGYYLMGMINLRKGDHDEVLRNLRTALFWDSRLFDAYVPLVKILVQRNDCLQARNYLQSAKEAAPDREELASLQRQVDRCSK